MATTKRKSLSKKVRFEVFKRDKFTCQYCGKMAPDVILHVDHIVPVSKGGTNDILNLVTSCKDCNLGKGARKLDDESTVKKQQRLLKELADKNEQLEMILEWKKSISNLEENEVEKLSQYISSNYSISLTEHGKKNIKKLVKQFSFQQVLDAIDIAFDKYYDEKCNSSSEIAFKKIGGICYNNSKSEKEKEETYRINYLVKCCECKFSYVNYKRLKNFLKGIAWSEEQCDTVKMAITKSRNWTEFIEKLEGDYGFGEV